jgi:hypothetical protein
VTTLAGDSTLQHQAFLAEAESTVQHQAFLAEAGDLGAGPSRKTETDSTDGTKHTHKRQGNNCHVE